MFERSLLIALLLLSMTVSAPAQDAAESEDESADVEVAAEEPDGQGEEEVLPTDDESYLDIDEEDFRPSEEIPADQSIAFPTDI